MGKDFGVCVCGQFDADDHFYPETYFPYLDSREVSTSEEVEVSQRLDAEAYSGTCDDLRMGVTLVFRVHNYVELIKSTKNRDLHELHPATALTGLSINGTILMPLYHSPEDVKKEKIYNMKRQQLLAKAREGDSEALEKVTEADMETYFDVCSQIGSSDVFSLVNTCCMPTGTECELFSILGVIEDVDLEENMYTGGQVYIMRLSCNGVLVKVAIAKDDLYGEPAIGRRFRGDVWLQGHLLFSDLSGLEGTGRESGEHRAATDGD